jgi:F420-dependent methylenetetrahydromethanopterin dehydrogenase
MPAMANITVKKNDAVTDITYSAVAASGGDASPATWKSSTVSTVPAFRPTFVVKSEWNGPKTARRLLTEFRYPTVVTDGSGKQSISDTMILTCTGTVPQGMTDTDINEACSQALNLMAATLVKDSFKSGYAPV